MSTLNEKLELIVQARNDIQTALANKGQIVGNDIRDYAEAVSNITTSEDLTDVLDAQDQRIAELEEALDGKTAGGGEPNIFLQDDEPAKKQGIWLKTSNKEYEKVVASDSVVEEPSWLPAGTITSVPREFWRGSAALVGGIVYLFGGQNYSNYSFYKNNYKYDLSTDTYTQIANNPYNLAGSIASVIGTDIYLFGASNFTTATSSSAYKYDTLTDTYTQLTNMPISMNTMTVSIGTDIFIFSRNTNTVNTYKYDTLTDTYTQLRNLPYTFYMRFNRSCRNWYLFIWLWF